MSIEEKAKAYDEALTKSKEFLTLCEKCGAKDTIDFLKDIFPELKESEDEKTRKEIIAVLKGEISYTSEEDAQKYIAWLEKQGEQNHSIDINKMIDDYANNKEPGNEIFGRPVPCMIRAYRQGLNDAIGKVVQKHAWSNEDEVKINRIVACLENLNVADNDILLKDVEWLKSFKERKGG